MYKPIVFALMLVVSAGLGAPRKSTSKATSKATSATTVPGIVSVYTLVGCPACAALKTQLRKSGVKLQIKTVQERYFETFPTVIYSNHKSDSGQRINKHRVRLPAVLEVFEAD